METTIHEEMDLMVDIERSLQNYVPGPYHWIARQMDTETRKWTNTYGIARGPGVCFVTVDEARNANDALIRKLASDIMGYAPGSAEDVAHRVAQADEFIRQYSKERDEAIKWVAYWQSVKDELTTPTPPAAGESESAT
jgi:hypothetical protein